MKEKRLVFRGGGLEGRSRSKRVESSDPVTAFADRLISGKQEKIIKKEGARIKAEKAEAKKRDAEAANNLLAELGLEPNKDEDFNDIINDLGGIRDVTDAAVGASSDLLHGTTASEYKAIVDGESRGGEAVIAKTSS